MEELATAGYSAEEIEEIVGHNEPEPFGIWPENEAALDIALHCQWDRELGAMGGQLWKGIQAEEIEAAMRSQGVAKPDRWTTLKRVRCFVIEACAQLNELEAERAEQQRSRNK